MSQKLWKIKERLEVFERTEKCRRNLNDLSSKIDRDREGRKDSAADVNFQRSRVSQRDSGTGVTRILIAPLHNLNPAVVCRCRFRVDGVELNQSSYFSKVNCSDFNPLSSSDDLFFGSLNGIEALTNEYGNSFDYTALREIMKISSPKWITLHNVIQKWRSGFSKN